VSTDSLGDGSGVGTIHFDREHKLLYALGKGDSRILMYEYTDAGKMLQIPPYQYNAPIRAISFLPKQCLSIDTHEVGRCARIAGDSTMEYISFRMPSRTGTFNSDLYPLFDANVPASDYERWAAGEDVPAKTMQLQQQAAASGSSAKKNNFLAKLGKSVPKAEEESKDAGAGSAA
jgi:coronin-1B/1C/6